MQVLAEVAVELGQTEVDIDHGKCVFDSVERSDGVASGFFDSVERSDGVAWCCLLCDSVAPDGVACVWVSHGGVVPAGTPGESATVLPAGLERQCRLSILEVSEVPFESEARRTNGFHPLLDLATFQWRPVVAEWRVTP